MDAISFWAWTGIVALVFLSIQDIFNKQWVDDRRNWFMFGATFFLIPLLHVNIWIALGGILVGGLYVSLAKKWMRGIGEADHNAIMWIILGFFFSGVYPLLVLLSVMILFMIGHYVIFKKIFEMKEVPFFPTMTIIFACSVFVAGLI